MPLPLYPRLVLDIGGRSLEQGVGLLLAYLGDILRDPAAAVLDREQLPEQLKEFGEQLQLLAAQLTEAACLAGSLANGEFNNRLPLPQNHLAAPLKSLHAALKHLTWQAQQVARGDYQQQIDFMGEFSDAFNSMIHQLEQQRRELLQEIADNRCKAEALEQSNSLLKAITRQILQWILVVDAQTVEWLFANRSPKEALLDPDSEPQLLSWLREVSQQAAACGGRATGELILQSYRGMQYFSAEVQPLQWQGHSALAFVLSDVSNEREQIRLLEHAAYRDKLTQLFNRHYGMDLLAAWVAERIPFILCYIDIDNLKYVNDRYGHSAGDRYILRVAEVLQSFGVEAVCCRLGGDEFMLLAKHVDAAHANAQMELLQAYLMEGDSSKIEYSISYGIIEVGRENSLSAEAILSIADERMYEHKRAY